MRNGLPLPLHDSDQIVQLSPCAVVVGKRTLDLQSTLSVRNEFHSILTLSTFVDLAIDIVLNVLVRCDSVSLDRASVGRS